LREGPKASSQGIAKGLDGVDVNDKTETLHLGGKAGVKLLFYEEKAAGANRLEELGLEAKAII